MIGRWTIGCLIVVALLALPTFARADDAATRIDLSSPTQWQAQRQGESEWKSAAIPGQLSVKNTTQRWIDYRRTIAIPAEAKDRAVLLHLESINDGGAVMVNDRTVGTVDYGLFPSTIDLTPFVQPDQSITLTLRCFSRNHYYTGGTFPQDHNGDELLGIPRGVALLIAPAVQVSDVIVRPSVTRQSLDLTAIVWNHTDRPKAVRLSAALRDSTGEHFAYPAIASASATIPPNTATPVKFDVVKWTLGSTSYWWPNIPFRKEYRAVLHAVDVSLAGDDQTADRCSTRFGFVEYGERGGAYTVNGVPVFQFQDGTQEHLWNPPAEDGFQTSYVRLAGWRTVAAAAETWRNYLRLGFNTFRLHSSAGSETMLDAADETGFMLVGESGIRGYAKPEEEWDPLYKPAAIGAMCRCYRNHPSVARYSLDNEWMEATRNEKIARGLIDAALAEDPTRPLSFSQDKEPWVRAFTASDGIHHAWALDHYHVPTTRPGTLCGIEESSWDRHGTDRNELVECARSVILARMNGLAVFAPWTLNNYWCNFVTGGSKNNGTTNIIWRNKDRADNVDGWNSDIVRFLQNCYSIYASADVELIEHHLNKEQLIFDPAKAETIQPGATSRRTLVMFNNSLQSHPMWIEWEARLGRPDGQTIASGKTDSFTLGPDEHHLCTIDLVCPASIPNNKLIRLVLKTSVDGATAFTEDRYLFRTAASATTQP